MNKSDPFKFKSAITYYFTLLTTYLCYFLSRRHQTTITICYRRANGAERRSGRKPGARVTNSALAFTHIRIMRSYIAQWHNRMKSRPPFWTDFVVLRMREYQARDWLRKKFLFC